MFDELPVAENIFMGHMPGGRFIDWGEMRRRSAELLARIEADFDAEAPLKQLSVAQKHMVEIARALATRPRSSSWTSRRRRCRATRSTSSSASSRN